jgi:hypothetical protein
MTAFLIGDRVRFQGGKPSSEIFAVIDLSTLATPFGDFVTYSLRSEATGNVLDVRNAHVRLELVQGKPRPASTKAAS